MEETYEPPYKYLWRKYMQDYLHEINDASDLRNHLIKTMSYQFTWYLPHVEVLIWKQLHKKDEFFQGMFRECSELMIILRINNYEDFVKKKFMNFY